MGTKVTFLRKVVDGVGRRLSDKEAEKLENELRALVRDELDKVREEERLAGRLPGPMSVEDFLAAGTNPTPVSPGVPTYPGHTPGTTLHDSGDTRDYLAGLCAAALADPDVDEHAKSLAGYWLRYLSGDDPAFRDEEAA